MNIAEEAARKFIMFVQRYEIGSRPILDGTLIGYIADWLSDGDGFEAVNNNFEIYTQTVFIIIDEWHKDPSLLDYRTSIRDGRRRTVKRRPPHIFKDDDDRRGWVLNSSYFNSMMADYRRRQKY